MARVYSAEGVKLTIAGQVILTGWDSISFERNNDNKSLQVSADGVVAKSTIADRTGVMTITAQQQNFEFAAQMAAIQNIIDMNPNSEVDLSMTVIDPSGGNSAVLAGVELQKMPAQSFGAEAESREYSYSINKITYVPVPENLSGLSRAASTALELREQILGALGIQ